MKAYFTASIRGKNQYGKYFEKIVHYLQKHHSVISDHILKADKRQILSESKEERLTYQKQLESWIQSSDFVVAEVSFPSVSVGYEISLAQHLGKPVLMLYTEESNPPSLLAHHRDEKLACEHYTEDTIESIVDDFINYVKGINDMRFTFFITSEIAQYLHRVTKEQKTPRSVYLRRLIEADMRKNS